MRGQGMRLDIRFLPEQSQGLPEERGPPGEIDSENFHRHAQRKEGLPVTPYQTQVNQSDKPAKQSGPCDW